MPIVFAVPTAHEHGAMEHPYGVSFDQGQCSPLSKGCRPGPIVPAGRKHEVNPGRAAPLREGGSGPYRPFGMLNHDLGHTQKRGVP